MNKIIACIDGSSATPGICDAAAWAQRQLEAPLELLHVLEKQHTPAGGDMSGNIGLGTREQLMEQLAELDHQRSRILLEQGRLMLAEAQQRIAAAGVPADMIAQRQRHDTLIDSLLEFEADTRLLVMGRQGEAHADARGAVGSHLETATRTLHRPILVSVGEFATPQRFMLAYDGSQTADKALDMVTRSPLLRGADCHLVSAGSGTQSKQSQLQQAQQALQSAGFDVTSAQTDGGEVVDALLAHVDAQRIDLVIMGAWGHSRIRQFLVGSVTSAMLHRSRVPLLLLR